MADKSHIEWTDATWNPITGCTLVSDGCTNCYAARMAATRLKGHPSRKGLARMNAKGVAKFTGELRFNQKWLDQPLGWTKPRRIFVCAHGDLFHEHVPEVWLRKIFAVMAMSPQHTFQILTKRPNIMAEYMSSYCFPGSVWSAMGEINPKRFAENARMQWPLPNVWLGTSVEDQATAEKRIPHLLAAPAALHFLSCEPLLDKIDLCNLKMEGTERTLNAFTGLDSKGVAHFDDVVEWLIAGGESGSHARPINRNWVRLFRDQCAEYDVPFLLKQWGVWFPLGEVDSSGMMPRAFNHDDPGAWVKFEDDEISLQIGKKISGRFLDGVIHDGFPGDEVHG